MAAHAPAAHALSGCSCSGDGCSRPGCSCPGLPPDSDPGGAACALPQMELARAERGSSSFPGPVVILADHDKEDMDEQLEVHRMAARGLVVGALLQC
jgi:hypothetical protein